MSISRFPGLYNVEVQTMVTLQETCPLAGERLSSGGGLFVECIVSPRKANLCSLHKMKGCANLCSHGSTFGDTTFLSVGVHITFSRPNVHVLFNSRAASCMCYSTSDSIIILLPNLPYWRACNNKSPHLHLITIPLFE